MKNSHIYRFFIRLWKILLSIYRDGGRTNEGFIGKPLLTQIYTGLLEIENLHRGEQMTLPQVNIKLLQSWGDNTRMFQESTEAILTTKKISRHTWKEVNMLSSSFHC